MSFLKKKNNFFKFRSTWWLEKVFSWRARTWFPQNYVKFREVIYLCDKKKNSDRINRQRALMILKNRSIIIFCWYILNCVGMPKPYLSQQLILRPSQTTSIWNLCYSAIQVFRYIKGKRKWNEFFAR